MAELLEPNEIFFTAFQPKQQHRFILYIEGIPAYVIKSAARPAVQTTKVTLDHINLKRHVAGKYEWQDIDIVLYDPIVPSAAQACMEWLRLAHESVTGRDGYTDFYKKDVTINVLGPVGDKVEEWTLKGAFPTSLDFGDLDWGTDDVADITITLSFDYAILQF